MKTSKAFKGTLIRGLDGSRRYRLALTSHRTSTYCRRDRQYRIISYSTVGTSSLRRTVTNYRIICYTVSNSSLPIVTRGAMSTVGGTNLHHVVFVKTIKVCSRVPTSVSSRSGIEGGPSRVPGHGTTSVIRGDNLSCAMLHPKCLQSKSGSSFALAFGNRRTGKLFQPSPPLSNLPFILCVVAHSVSIGT